MLLEMQTSGSCSRSTEPESVRMEVRIPLFFFFFMTKIGPELTSVANLPVCLRKIVTELTSVPIFLYFMWDAATAWLHKPC